MHNNSNLSPLDDISNNIHDTNIHNKNLKIIQGSSMVEEQIFIYPYTKIPHSDESW